MKSKRKNTISSRNRFVFKAVIILVFVLMVIALSVWYIRFSLRHKGVSSTLTAIAEESETSGADKSMEEDFTGQIIIEVETDIESSTETVVETQQSDIYLASLSGQDPGTIISAEKIDMENLDKYFMDWPIEVGDNLYEKIIGKSYRENSEVPISSLCYLKMPHYNFEGEIQVGEMIVNVDVKDAVKKIFKELFIAEYQIKSMYLIDKYWTGDPAVSDSKSIDKNNTSAFCYRRVTGGSSLSNHAYGRAIDINPQQNPYVSYQNGNARWYHSNSDAYIARDTGRSHVITHEDLAYKIFTKYGFTWGGDWNNPKDYQHFEYKK